jgi:preprotein translocase subunit SecB
MSKRMPPAKYRSLLDRVELKRLSFTEIYSKLSPENLSEGSISVQSKNETEISCDKEGKVLSAIDKYQFVGSIKEKTVIEINVHILAIFDALEKPTSEFIDLFQRNTLKVITYPYLRQIVQDLTSKMGVAPLVLPMWKTPKKSNHHYLASADNISKN